MKKVILSFVVLGAIGSTSCSNDDSFNNDNVFYQSLANENVCSGLWNTYELKGNEYAADNSISNCNAYKNATTALLNSGAACIGEEQQNLQLVFESLNCSN